MTKPITEPFLKRALKDPLLHFLILGGMLFAAVSIWGNDAKPKNEIVITRAGQQHLADLFSLTWQRQPTADELSNLVEEHIKEEVYYRESLALGLDTNDTIVRRRLRQKLEFMQEDLSSLAEPTDNELKAYYEAHIDKYQTDHIFSFKQILISSSQLKDDDPEIIQLLVKLQSGTQPEKLSHSSLLPVSMNLETEKSITNTFGMDFMEQISDFETKGWSGPIYSGFGTHLVNVSLNQGSKPLTFEQAKSKVAIDYTQNQREQAAVNYYESLRGQYIITIENPE